MHMIPYGWITDGVLIFIFAATLIISIKRGFMKTVSGLASVIGAVIISKMFAFVVEDLLEVHVFAPMMQRTVSGILENAYKGIELTLDQAVDAVSQVVRQTMDKIAALGGAADSTLAERLEGVADFDALDANVASLANSISEPISQRISEIAAFLLVFVVAYLLLRLVFSFFSLLTRLPLLQQANSFLGGVCGAVLGIVYVWVAAQILAFLFGILCANGTLPPEVADGTLFRFLIGGEFVA